MFSTKKMALLAALGFTGLSADDTNELNGPGNIVISGKENRVDGKFNTLEGFKNLVKGDFNDIDGDVNEIKGNDNDVWGDDNLVIGNGNLVMGTGNKVSSGSRKDQSQFQQPSETETLEEDFVEVEQTVEKLVGDLEGDILEKMRERFGAKRAFNNGYSSGSEEKQSFMNSGMEMLKRVKNNRN